MLGASEVNRTLPGVRRTGRHRQLCPLWSVWSWTWALCTSVFTSVHWVWLSFPESRGCFEDQEVQNRKLCADSKTQQRHRIIVISVSISVLLLGFQRTFSSFLLLNVQQLCEVGRADDRTLIYRGLRLFVMDREAWHAAIHGVAELDMTERLNWIELNWRLFEGFPGGAVVKEPACQCRRHKRCKFDPWVGKIPWRRAWQSTPVFLPGESHGQRSLAGCSLWDCKRVRHN